MVKVVCLKMFEAEKPVHIPEQLQLDVEMSVQMRLMGLCVLGVHAACDAFSSEVNLTDLVYTVRLGSSRIHGCGFILTTSNF